MFETREPLRPLTISIFLPTTYTKLSEGGTIKSYFNFQSHLFSINRPDYLEPKYRIWRTKSQYFIALESFFDETINGDRQKRYSQAIISIDCASISTMFMALSKFCLAFVESWHGFAIIQIVFLS